MQVAHPKRANPCRPGPVLCLITRVRLRGRPWILWLRFELYVNLERMTLPEG